MKELKKLLKMIWKNIKLRNELKRIAKIEKDISDIIVFGSIVRGKINPKDIDVLIIFNKTVDKNIEYKIRKILENYYSNISAISKTKQGVFEPSFDAKEGIFMEGISLLSGKSLRSNYGLENVGLFRYDSHVLSNNKKTMFYYALNGRNGKDGVIKESNSIKLADNVILTPNYNTEMIKDFFELWGLKYVLISVLIPDRLNKKNILSKE